MSYDVECLEVMAELVVAAYRDSEQKSAVIPAVECGRYRVYIEFLPQIEGSARERNTFHIYLRSQSAVPYKPFYGIGKALVYEITVRRHYSLIFEQGNAGRVYFRFQVLAYDELVL